MARYLPELRHKGDRRPIATALVRLQRMHSSHDAEFAFQAGQRVGT